MKFIVHRTRKDCVIPTAALNIAGLKRDKELRLEVENGVIVVLRPAMNAGKLLSVSAFLTDLAAGMIAAVAAEADTCSGCKVCFADQTGIRKGRRWYAGTEDGVFNHALPDKVDHDDDPLDRIPESVHQAFLESDICIRRLREIVCDNDPLPY